MIDIKTGLVGIVVIPLILITTFILLDLTGNLLTQGIPNDFIIGAGAETVVSEIFPVVIVLIPIIIIMILIVLIFSTLKNL